MKRSSAPLISLVGVIGVALGYVTEVLVVKNGLPILQLQPTYSVVVIAVGVALVALAWPIFRSVRNEKSEPVNPFWAVRVLLLSQASALSGGLLSGFSAGIVFWVLQQAVLPAAVLWTGIAAFGASVVLLVLSLVAEHLCVLPPDDPEQSGAST